MAELNKTILVTGIGGNVGQGILRNLSRSFPEVRRLGTDVSQTTAGHRWCHAFAQVPYASDDGFADRFRQLCHDSSTELIIPSTDDEAYVLGCLAADLPALVASPPAVTGMFRDKQRTYSSCSQAGIPFAETLLPADFDGRWPEVVVKPRAGRGSREVVYNPQDLTRFDDSFVVQPLCRGPEITSAFYVTRSGRLLGPITFERRLHDGMTERCCVSFDHDEALDDLARSLVAAFPIAGPCNVQSIVMADGAIIPFEINCRYSGTNSIRAQFGFEDVKYGVQEYLYGDEPDQPRIAAGAALRVYLDVIYPGQRLDEIAPGTDDSHLF